MITHTSLASFELISVPHSLHAPAESFKNLLQINSDLHLIHTLRGHGNMRFHNHTLRTDPTCIICVPPHIQCLYDKSPGAPWEMINLHIHITAGASSLLTLPARFTPPNITAIHRHLKTILKHTQSSDPLSRIKALTTTLTLISSYIAAHAVTHPITAPQDPLITRIRHQIQAQAAHPIDVDALAAQVGLSRSQLTRRFKKETNLSVKQFWSQKRLAMAQSLLRETNWPLAQIADHLHFSDVFYLSRWFSNQAKLSPTEYRKNTRAINH